MTAKEEYEAYKASFGGSDQTDRYYRDEEDSTGKEDLDDTSSDYGIPYQY